MVDNVAFLKKTAEEKISEIISRAKQALIDGEVIPPAFYLFDRKDILHVLDIDDPTLLKKNKQPVVGQLIKEKIKEMNAANLGIYKVMFLREGYYDKSYPDKNNMDLDKSFNRSNGNEALIVTLEDELEFTVKVYDMINFFDSGKRFTVLSENPIDDVSFYKIDPETNVRTNYINLL